LASTKGLRKCPKCASRLRYSLGKKYLESRDREKKTLKDDPVLLGILVAWVGALISSFLLIDYAEHTLGIAVSRRYKIALSEGEQTFALVGYGILFGSMIFAGLNVIYKKKTPPKNRWIYSFSYLGIFVLILTWIHKIYRSGNVF
jgi:hypothetical protein